MDFDRGFVEKVYAGLLGKIIGVRLGAPVEPLYWTAEKIKEAYGEITDYIKSYRNFAADDDINGPVFFIRAILDGFQKTGVLSEKDIGDAWLNYTAEGHGMFWWGGYGTSTEHTAYMNLQNGILPPDSGSIAKNGKAIAEQIGGQIFIDTWGLVCPGDAFRAAELTRMAACVSHDGNAIFGGQFVAACISLAFVEKEMIALFQKALTVIPKDCEYSQMATDVFRIYQQHPDDWHKTWEYVKTKYSDQKYPGIVHIIPNGAVIVLSLLHGNGDFSKTVTIATMCGWDTDCNAGNVGTILGVFSGLEGIEKKWRKPIGDFVVTSSVIGSLNIHDLPTLAKTIAHCGFVLNQKQSPFSRIEETPHLHFDFSIPGSTHSIRAFPENRITVFNTDEISPAEPRQLQVRVNFAVRNSEFKVFYKPFYRRKDFDDERYIPNFSPVVYPGQILTTSVETEDIHPEQELAVKPYVQDTQGKQWVGETLHSLTNGKPTEISYPIPDRLEGAVIEEIGLKFYNSGRESFYGNLKIPYFSVEGKSHFTIDPAKQAMEFGTVTPFTFHKGFWTLTDGKVQGVCADEGNLYTGSLFWKDVDFKTLVEIPYGEQAYILLRVRGNLGYYAFGFEKAQAVAYRWNATWNATDKKKLLFQTPFAWNHQDRYLWRVESREKSFTFSINHQVIFTVEDQHFERGMIGYRIAGGSRIFIHSLEMKEL